MPEIYVIQHINIIISARRRNAQNKTFIKAGKIKCFLILNRNEFKNKTVYFLSFTVLPVFIPNLLSFII